MKRVIPAIAAAMISTSVVATPVQAASADPVKALRSQFVAGKGVKFTDVSALVEFAGNTSFLKRTGSFQFGKAGIVASDVNAKLVTDEAAEILGANLRWSLDRPERTIRIGTTSYYSGGPWAPPKGKTWIKHPHGMNAGFSGWHGQLVNVAESATLKTLITKGKRTGRTYSGTISFGALEKVSPWLRNSGLTRMSKDEKAAVLRFKLTLGPDQLPQRLITVYPGRTHISAAVGEDRQVSVETRYTGWGRQVTVKAPPRSEVGNM